MIQILTTPLLYGVAALALVLTIYLMATGSPPRTAHRLLAGAFLLVGVQAGLAALQISAPAHDLVAIRPILAMGLAPLLFLHLECAGRPLAQLKFADLVHLTGPVAMAIFLAAGLRGDAIDWMIIGSFTLYAAMTAVRAKAGTFAAHGAEVSRSLVRWRYLVIAWLVVMALVDLAILIELIRGEALENSVTFLLAAALIAMFFASTVLMNLHRIGPMAWVSMQLGRLPARSAIFDVPGTYQVLEEHMKSTRAFLDPNLTVARLARRVALPQRHVSEAINRSKGKSFSQWVNTWRVQEAQRLIKLDPQQGLLDVLLAAGFQTKSNFNRAFKEVVGLTPSEWRATSD